MIFLCYIYNNYEKRDIMNDMFKDLINNDDSHKNIDLLVDLNNIRLKDKNNIKKYRKIRNLHNTIMDDMQDYIYHGGEIFNYYSPESIKEIRKIINKIGLGLNLDNPDDLRIFFDLIIYDNLPSIKPVVDIYLENKKYNNAEKNKMLEAMENSVVSLFLIKDADKDNGYVTYEDVFTKKQYQVVDVALSSSFIASDKIKLYIYNRIITYDDMTIATGLNCAFTSESEQLKKFLKKNKFKENSSFENTLMLYKMSKNDASVFIKVNDKYINK